MRVLVTGGAGFIGSNFARRLIERRPDYRVTVLDALTYAGNLANLAEVAEHPRFRFVEGDITDAAVVDELVAGVDAVVNFAAETHVDRSIQDAGRFVQTDVLGTWVLLEAARRHGLQRFVQVSTDEVYGHVPVGASSEDDPLRPRSPYSASKASGDLMVQAYAVTYGLPVCLTRGANTIGPYQYPEKVVPLFTTNAIDDLPMPVYGDGGALRDYLFVDDHCDAIELVLHAGQVGEAYNVGAGNSVNTIQLARAILGLLGKPESLMQFVPDRPGHDRRYYVDWSKLRNLGWSPRFSFEAALERTVRWYAEREDWWRPLKDASFAAYYERNYTSRLMARSA